MPAAPLLDAALNEHGHVVPCGCGECMPPGADGVEDDVQERRAEVERARPKYLRGTALHAWNRKLTA